MRNSAAASVLLPLPLRPTTAQMAPAGTLKESPLSASGSLGA